MKKAYCVRNASGFAALKTHSGKDIREDERHTNPTLWGASRAYASGQYSLAACGTPFFNEFATDGAYAVLFGELTTFTCLLQGAAVAQAMDNMDEAVADCYCSSLKFQSAPVKWQRGQGRMDIGDNIW